MCVNVLLLLLLQLLFAMFSTRLLDDVGPAPCYNVIANLMKVKEVNGEQTLLGWVRAKDSKHCPVGALAMYLVYIIDIQGVNLLDIMTDDLVDLMSNGVQNYYPRWRQAHLFHGADIFKELSINTHITDINNLLNASELVNRELQIYILIAY
jgi:hypothetical protein